MRWRNVIEPVDTTLGCRSLCCELSTLAPVIAPGNTGDRCVLTDDASCNMHHRLRSCPRPPKTTAGMRDLSVLSRRLVETERRHHHHRHFPGQCRETIQGKPLLSTDTDRRTPGRSNRCQARSRSLVLEPSPRDRVHNLSPVARRIRGSNTIPAPATWDTSDRIQSHPIRSTGCLPRITETVGRALMRSSRATEVGRILPFPSGCRCDRGVRKLEPPRGYWR